MWVSGTTYAAGVVVFSPADYQYFMRKTAGAGATDPSTDTTNWQPTGDRAVKSIQRGEITLAFAAGGTGTATISAVVPAKSELRFLGSSPGTTMEAARIVLTNSTTITATRGTIASSSTVIASWELTERY